MLTEKNVVIAATTASLLAIGACLIVLPSLYNEINDVHNMKRVQDSENNLHPSSITPKGALKNNLALINHLANKTKAIL
ncbi:unnamed protein product [Nippostrongylus brasiliensis]|uniref:Col_cuticle_N domain-containing protein n=1 Tax=Nippostrongylus brasiliensis TaxID=27835 RepID=A0A0N4YT83_NIPBR|nr:unnamed protein product [Nippostrongylus brasiliensis]